MDLDRSFVSHLVTSEDADVFKYAVKNIPIEIVQGMERKVYRWIIEYYRLTKGHLPTPKTVVQEFRGYKLLRDVKERVEFFEHKFKQRFEYKILTKGVTEVGQHLFSEDVEQAKEAYREIGMQLGRSAVAELTNAKDGLINRKRTYLEAKAAGGKIGYYMGIPTMDKHLGGLQKEFMIIMGDTSIGKTFLAMMLSCNIWPELKECILIVSNEMDTESMYKRIDSIMGKFNHSRYRKGQLNSAEEIRLRDLSKVYDKLSPLIVLNGAGKSVMEIEYDIIALAPSLVVVDGIYLTDMGKNDQTADTIAAAKAYQRINKKYGMLLIATSQMIAGQTKYARALQENADIVMKLWDNQALRDMLMKGLSFTKIREEDKNFVTYMNWDFDKWDFSEADVNKGIEGSQSFGGL